jgi:5-methyltetrahydrofolate--homocysteine methyltransferase
MADFESLKQMIIDGNDAATAATQALIDGGAGARDILDNALLPGMDVVGAQMKSGDKFIPEVLLSARTMQACLDLIKPLLGEGGGSLGTVVIGTVEGDMHDIGKNLVAMLLSGAGFEVVNLGKGITPADFVAAVKEHDADILGMSGLLTTTIPKMPETIQALKDAGLRDKVKVIIGGAPVSAEWAAEIGADAYGANATLGVEKCKELLSVNA